MAPRTGPVAGRGVLWRRRAGDPASAIYGTIVAAGLLAAEGDAGRSVPTILVSTAASLTVFWLAHAYAHLLADRVNVVPAPPGIRRVLRAELPILESGIAPCAALLVARAAGASLSTAVLVALLGAVAELFAWAALAGRRSGLPVRQAAPYVIGAGLLGVALVTLKFLVH